jgi:hypothetical protein
VVAWCADPCLGYACASRGGASEGVSGGAVYAVMYIGCCVFYIRTTYKELTVRAAAHIIDGSLLCVLHLLVYLHLEFALKRSPKFETHELSRRFPYNRWHQPTRLHSSHRMYPRRMRAGRFT